MVVLSLFFLWTRFFIFFRPYEFFGVYIAIIFGVARYILPFLFLLLLATFAFAHMFYMLLHPSDKSANSLDPNNPWNLSPVYNEVINGTITNNTLLVQKPDNNTNMFTGFGTALMATYILFSGMFSLCYTLNCMWHETNQCTFAQ